MADLSVQGANFPTLNSAKTNSDTSSGITTISTGTVQDLIQAFPDVARTRAMDPPQSVRVADNRPLQ